MVSNRHRATPISSRNSTSHTPAHRRGADAPAATLATRQEAVLTWIAEGDDSDDRMTTATSPLRPDAASLSTSVEPSPNPRLPNVLRPLHRNRASSGYFCQAQQGPRSLVPRPDPFSRFQKLAPKRNGVGLVLAISPEREITHHLYGPWAQEAQDRLKNGQLRKNSYVAVAAAGVKALNQQTGQEGFLWLPASSVNYGQGFTPPGAP